MRSTLYLIRQAEALAPFEGRLNPPLSRRGIRQAEMTRDFLAMRPMDACYCSPRWRAVQTAEIIAAPHRLQPQRLGSLDEGIDFDSVQARVCDGIEQLMQVHAGKSILVVAHRYVHLAYIAAVLQLSQIQAAAVALEHCGISVVVREDKVTTVATLNAAFHLQGLAA